MDQKLSSWSGFPVYGDPREIEAIAESEGPINIDKGDITCVLSQKGENWVVAGVAPTIKEALVKAIGDFPFTIDKIQTMLIEFWYDETMPTMPEIADIHETLSKMDPESDLTWGFAIDPSLGENFKAVLLASVKS